MPTTADALTYHNYIDGRWAPSTSGEVFENRNPADTDDLIGVFQKSTGADAEAAIAAAGKAYTRWRLVPAPRRAEILFDAARLLVERKEQFARDMTREMGKVLKETRGDVQ
jgi:alpha-ketoglutaric semialdehyde dehydrogenase